MNTAPPGRLAALRELWGNPALRRAELAWGGFHTAEWATLVALSVVAFSADGPRAVGVVLFARMIPSAVLAPLVAVAGDRAPRERILLAVHFVRAVACLGAAVALLLDGPVLVVYVFCVLAAVPLAAHRPCHRTKVPGADIELLQRTSIFSPLPYAALRRLAPSLGERHARAREVLVRQGDDGEVVYVIAEGRVSVDQNGDVLRELGPDEVFGELALILDVPRTATVTAIEPVVLRTLAREPFLAAVTANTLSSEALDRLVAARSPAAPAAATTG